MRILITDDHAVVRQGYTSLLRVLLPSCEVVEAGSGEQAVSTCQNEEIDLVIMDVNLPGISGIEAARRILVRNDEIKILFFSMYMELPLVKQALDAGAHGYVTKSSAPDVLIDAVNRVSQGQIYVEHELAMKLAMNRTEQVDQRLRDMTQREFEVFVMLARGLSVKLIAERLCISSKTVSNYTANLKSKLQVTSTAELVHLAIETGIIQLGRQT